MPRAATTLADPCTGAQRRDFLLGLHRGIVANSSGHKSHHGAQGTGWVLVAPNELARLASLQLMATRRLRRVQVGVPQDFAEALRWYRVAAEKGNEDAQICLGDMYRLGQGVLKDPAEAERWYRTAGK